MIDTDKIEKEWCKVRGIIYDKGVEVYDYRDLSDYIFDLLAEVKRLRKENKKQLDVLSTLDEMIRYGKDHVDMMKALEQGLDLLETWKEMVE